MLNYHFVEQQIRIKEMYFLIKRGADYGICKCRRKTNLYVGDSG